MKDVGVHVRGVTLQDALAAVASLVELPCEEQRLDRIELCGGVMGQQVSRSNELLQRVARIVDRGIRAGETIPCIAEKRILLNRVSIRQDRLFVTVFREVGVSSLQVRVLGDVRIAPAGGTERRAGDEQQQRAEAIPEVH
jgi:hypothetical protein